MSHQQKVSFNDILAAHIERVENLHPEFSSFAQTVRYLVVVGLAAEYARQGAIDQMLQNPFLTLPKELMDP